MRFLLKNTESADTLLEKMVQSAYLVVEGSIPESRQEDIQMGLYVALRQVLSQYVVKCDDCGKLPDCTGLREAPAFTAQAIPSVVQRA
jgi:hypothetical protein